jgi:hypothetical protein
LAATGEVDAGDASLYLRNSMIPTRRDAERKVGTGFSDMIMLKQVSGWRWGSALSGVFRWATGIRSFMVRGSANRISPPAFALASP